MRGAGWAGQKGFKMGKNVTNKQRAPMSATQIPSLYASGCPCGPD